MRVQGEALELAFRMLLSCPCDVTPEQERAVFDYLRSIPQGQTADYAPVLAAFGPNTSTPFHRLAAFSSWRAPDPAEVTIERHDVLRVNASSYHWDLAASGLPNAYKKIRSVPSWQLAHTLLPVTVHKAAEDGGMVARYTFADGEVSLANVFFPPEFEVDESLHWAIHFAAILGPLDEGETHLVSALNEAIPMLPRMRREVGSIDYGSFELQGDYRELCRRRHALFLGERTSRSSPS